MRPLLSLTGVRFFAAMAVVFFHIASGGHLPVPLARLLGMGYTAVNFFFVLSGFILAYSYLGRTSSVDARTFWIARFARVYPVYALATLIALPFFLTASHPTDSKGSVLTYALSNFALLQSWNPLARDHYNFNVPSWSLSVEAFFYLVFPLLAAWTARLSRSALVPALIATILLAVAVSLPMTLLLHNASPGAVSPWVRASLALPPVHLPEFFFGMVLGRLFLEEDRERSVGPRVPWLGWVALATLVLLSQVPGLGLLKETGGLTVVFGALIWALAHERGRLASFLSLPPLVLLGEASYGIYILHIPILTLLVWSTGSFHLERPGLYAPSRLLFAVVVVIVSVVVHRYFELPAREWIRARFTRLRPQPVA